MSKLIKRFKIFEELSSNPIPTNTTGYGLDTPYGSWGVNFGNPSTGVSGHFGDKINHTQDLPRQKKKDGNALAYYNSEDGSYLMEDDIDELIKRYKIKCNMNGDTPILVDKGNLGENTIRLMSEYIKESVSSPIKKILYHGTVHGRFKKFNREVIFLTDNYRFAEDYASQKSFEAGMDADIDVCEVEFNGILFDHTNEHDIKSLLNKLPETIKVYDIFGFYKEFNKFELIDYIKGEIIDKPIEYIANANIGDIIPNPSYAPEKELVYKKDSDYVYTIDMKSINYNLQYAMKIDREIHGSKKYYEMGNKLRELKKDIYKKYTGKKFFYEHDINMFFYYKKEEIDKKDLEVIDIEIAKLTEDIKKYMFEQEIYTKYILNPTKIVLKSNWQYFENTDVLNALRELGYDAYSARESNHKTYAVINRVNEVLTIKRWL